MSIKTIKTLKRVGFSFLTLALLLLIGGAFGIWKFNNAFFKERPDILTYTSEPKPISFDWVNQTFGSFKEEKTAIVIPASIEEVSHQFYLQFDTGSAFSYIYENALKSLREMGLPLNEVVIDDERYVKKLEIVLGGNKTTISNLKILKNHGKSFTNKDSLKSFSIGTIGSDFLHDAITVIDFKKQSLQFYEERPAWMNQLKAFESFDFQGRRVMLPATINGTKRAFLYDTGCSAFGLITTKNRYDQFTDENSEEIFYEGNSWGDALPIKHKTTGSKMSIGSNILNLKRVSFINKYAAMQPFFSSFTRIGGFLGNLPFAESTLILDTKTEEFLIIEDSQLLTQE